MPPLRCRRAAFSLSGKGYLSTASEAASLAGEPPSGEIEFGSASSTRRLVDDLTGPQQLQGHSRPDGVEPLIDRFTVQYPASSVLLAPFRVGTDVVGLLALGRIPDDHQAGYSRLECERLREISGQLAAHVNGIRLREHSEQRAHLQRRFEEYSRQLLEERDDTKLRVKALNLALDLVGWPIGAFYRYAFVGNRLNHVASRGLPEPTPFQVLNMVYGQGIVGLAAKNRQAMVVEHYQQSDLCDVNVPHIPMEVAIAIPVMPYRDLNSVLFLANPFGGRLFLDLEREILVRFVARVASALGSLPIRHPELMLRDLNALQLLSESIQSDLSQETIGFRFLTAVTASYGLRFNRAQIYLFDEWREQLQGFMGIGHLALGDARRSWEADDQMGRTLLSSFNEIPPDTSTPVDAWVKSYRIGMTDPDGRVFRDVAETRVPLIVTDY